MGLACLYSATVVARARRATPELIAEALAAPTIELSPDDLSGAQLDAVLLVQDPRFFQHRGWDFAGGRITTITQALVKVYYFERFRPGLAKIRQSLIARFALDPLVSKEDQLRLFLNVVYLGTLDGKPVHGLAEGARTYFGKPFAALSEDEFLALVAMFDAPNRFDPKRHPEENAARVREIRAALSAGRSRRTSPRSARRDRGSPSCGSRGPR